MLMRNAAKPLYLQLFEQLESGIKSGTYSKDSKLPSEKELCEAFNVSRITVRKALKLLEDKGMAYSVQGKGSYVKVPLISTGLAKIRTFGEMLAENGYDGYTKILSYEEKPVDDFERLWTGSDWGTADQLSLLGYSMGEPVVLYKSAIRSPIGEQMYQEALKKAQRREPFSTFDLYPLIGLSIGKVNQQILAINADEEIADMLKYNIGDPVLVLESVILDRNLRAVEYKKGYYRTDKYAFMLHREI
ncbi:MAG: GntR family transcriptional regulator [Anaerovoracaceae bacterium]|jgi:GntR family transcriptional regulator